MWVLFALGFSSGLPLKLVYATLALWLADAGVDKATVGLLGLASLPYTLKFLWAPVLDRLSLGALDRRLGRRRSWLLVSQVGLAVSLGWMASTDPSVDVTRTALCALLVAFWSATQDIAVDGYRVELLEVREQGAGTAMAVMGYRVGMLAAGAGALHLVAAWADPGVHGQWAHRLHDTFLYGWFLEQGPWNLTYRAMAMLVGVGMVAACVAPRPEEEVDAAGGGEDGTGRRLAEVLLRPFVAFVQRGGWLAVVWFLLFFKLGDALASAMTNTFLYEIGYSLRQIADIRDSWGLVASIVGIAVGGGVVRVLGLVRSLWASLVLMMGSNLLFSWLAVVGVSSGWLALTIGFENLTGGIATAAFVAWLSAQCERRFAASQYALLTSLAALAHIGLGAGSGWLAERTGWVVYFGLTAVASVPALFALWGSNAVREPDPRSSREQDAAIDENATSNG